jgi:hypothetical protein
MSFTKAVEIMPNYIKPRASRMNILKIDGEYKEALEDAEKIYQIDPNYPYPGLKKLIGELKILIKGKNRQTDEIVSYVYASDEETKTYSKKEYLKMDT